LPLAAIGLAAALGGCAYPYGYGYGYGYPSGYGAPYAYNYGYAAPSVGFSFGGWGGHRYWDRDWYRR
jgi:hypothetical protein